MQGCSEACIRAVTDILRRGGPLTSYRANPKIGPGPMEGSYAWQLEREIEKTFKVKYAVVTSSGTAALHAALDAVGVDGREVITSPVTFSATAAAIVLAGGIPVFADIDHETALITEETIEAKITANTAAILPVDLFGQIVKLPTESFPPIVFDSCQAVGCQSGGIFAGTSGVAGAYSFGGQKQYAAGEGGAVVTNSEGLAYYIRLFINHGENFGAQSRYNYRLAEIPACIAIHKLRELPLNRKFKEHYLVAERGQNDKPYIEKPLHRMAAFMRYARGPLPIAERLCERELCVRS